MTTCPCCDFSDVRVEYVVLDATEIGLPGGLLQGVEQITCDRCGEVSLSVPAQGAVTKEYRKQLAQIGRPLVPAEFAYLRRSLGVNGREYADTVGVSNVTISRLENGDAIPTIQDTMIRALTLLDLFSRDAIAQLAARCVDVVRVDVAAVERSIPQDLSGGWQAMPEPSNPPNNVVVFRRSTAANEPLEDFEFDEEVEDFGCRLRA